MSNTAQAAPTNQRSSSSRFVWLKKLLRIAGWAMFDLGQSCSRTSGRDTGDGERAGGGTMSDLLPLLHPAPTAVALSALRLAGAAARRRQARAAAESWGPGSHAGGWGKGMACRVVPHAGSRSGPRILAVITP